jgi:hypothetical protein
MRYQAYSSSTAGGNTTELLTPVLKEVKAPIDIFNTLPLLNNTKYAAVITY